jgi:hypothetical protein
MRKFSAILTAMILLFCSSNVFAQSNNQNSLVGTIGAIEGVGYFGILYESSVGNNSIVLQYKKWDVIELFSDLGDEVEDKPWRTYLSGGYRRYLSKNNYGPYLQASIDIGLEYVYKPEDEVVFSYPISSEGVALAFGNKIKILNFIVLDLGISTPISLNWPAAIVINNVYLPATYFGIGIEK